METLNSLLKCDYLKLNRTFLVVRIGTYIITEFKINLNFEENFIKTSRSVKDWNKKVQILSGNKSKSGWKMSK